MGNPNPWPVAWSLTGVCLLVLLGGGAYVYSASQPEKLQPVTSYAQFVADDKAFQCQYPSGWKVKSAQPQGISSYANFRKGAAEINIDADLQGSLMGDIMRSQQTMAENPGGDFAGGGGGGSVPGLEQLPGGGGMAPNDRRPPVERLHEAKKEDMDSEHEGYQEQPPAVLQSALGEGRVSTYTYKGEGWAGKMKGIRATILANEKLVSVLCECPERDFTMLKPAFDRVLQTLKPGGP